MISFLCLRSPGRERSRTGTWKRQLLLACLLVVTGAASVSAQTEEPLFEVSATKFLMGTRVEATVMYGDLNVARQALVRAFKEMERVEQLMSVHMAQSEISQINDQAGRTPVHVSRETFALLQRAKGYGERFDGLFDVSIGPLTEAWGFNSDHAVTLPDSATLDTLRGLVDYHDIVLDDRDTTVYLARPGMRLDLGGVAKGYAIDRAVAVLRAQGVANFLLNAGGDVYVSGRKSEDQAWKIGVKHPRKPDDLIATMEAQDIAIATSGDYERFVEIDGRRYHHIIDPRTGFPAALNQSVTVLAATAEEADALATYLFVRGLASDGNEPDDTPPFFIIDAAGHVHFTPSLVEQNDLTLLPQ